MLPLSALVLLGVGYRIGRKRRPLAAAALVPAVLMALTVHGLGPALTALVVTYVLALFLLMCGALLRRPRAAALPTRGRAAQRGR